MGSKKSAPQTDETDVADVPEEERMSLEELAETTNVAPRTIRYYQTKKLLQRPIKDEKDARLARYGPEHVERLRLIGELHDRGLKLPAIRTLLESGDASTRVADWLGLDATLSGSWTAAEPRLLNSDELAAALDGTPAGTKGLLEDARLLDRQGDSWLVRNPPLLDLTVGLIKEGIHADLVLEAGAILQNHLSRAANELIDLFVEALAGGFGDGADAGTVVQPLRPVAGDAARMIFGQQLEVAVAALLADTKRLGKR